MSSYHQDLNKFEELLAYRNERPLTEWEEGEFWSLIEKHPRFIEMLSKDSQKEALLASFSDEEFKEMGFKLPAKNIIPFPDNKQGALIETYNNGAIWKVASVLVASLILVILFRSESLKTPTSSDQNSLESSLVVSDLQPERELTAQEQYELKIAKIPQSGSMKRPPTGFNSTNSGEHEELSFGRDIRPILSEYCFHCHGPDEKSREAKLRLDTAEGMLKKDAIVPGNPDKSEAIVRIYLDDPDEIMPPPKSHKTMKPEEKEKLKRWVKQGAKWQGHWAFESPEKSEPPQVEKEWNKNPIDKFIFAKMKEKGLEPNPKADPYVLARRLSLDLTGLPMSLNKIKKYVEKDPEGNLNALIDDLMNSPAYGEHRAHYWLDAARYGDTHGMHLDNYREMWPYRDWVIKAYNDNMPFDQFTIEQFAGDLLPNSSVSQKIATGFHRNNVTTSEGGSIPEEFKVRYNVDRVATTGAVYMGLTVGCTQCHDHKFDPITQKEFYQLFAFFNNTTQNPMDGNKKDSPPFIKVEIGEGTQEYKEKVVLRDQAKAKLDEILKSPLPEKLSITKDQLVSNQSLLFHANFQKPDANQEIPLLVKGKNQNLKLTKNLTWSDNVELDGALVMNEKGGLKFQEIADFEATDHFSISFWYKPSDGNHKTLFHKVEKQEKHVGWDIMMFKKKLQFQMRSNEQYDNVLKVTSNLAFQINKWNHVALSYTGGRTNQDVQVYINGKKAVLNSNHRHKFIAGTIKNKASLMIGQNLAQGAMADIRIYERQLNEEEFGLLYRLKAIEKNLMADRTKLKPDDLLWLKKAHLSNSDKNYQQSLSEYFKLANRVGILYNQFPTTLVMQENAKSMPMANILDRGEYDRKREEVKPAIPAVLGGWKDSYPNNRLGLAKWIVAKENPLTARVTVNRLWQQFFGHGIVKSADDFGAMGARPTHPKLLDWLAVEFIESGWDVKHMIKLIVTSNTYQQSSQYRDDHFKLDPENSYLARGPRFRLHAEVLRDQALSVSGLLVDKLGGPSVKPYQPDGIWKAVAYVGSNTGDFVRDHGESLYRRSIYTFWKRTAPPASLAVFDAPSRENCTVKRERTNTPMQALNMMNDEQYIEAARYFAQRMIKDVKNDIQRIKTMGYRVLGYPPNEREMAMMNEALKKYLNRFAEQPDQAKAFVNVGDMPTDSSIDPVQLASWTMLASTLFNRDDVISKN